MNARLTLIVLAGFLAANLSLAGCGGDAGPPGGTCDASELDCGGTCVDPLSDSDHCGACDTVCSAGELCEVGACVSACDTNETWCDAACTDLQSDRDNCGDCGEVCGANEVCASGACSLSCPTGLTNCSGDCQNLETDYNNCGGCGTTCAAGEVCNAGSCVVSCQAGLTDCSGVCVDTSYDPANCGGCGTNCASAEACVSGTCVSLALQTVLIVYSTGVGIQYPQDVQAKQIATGNFVAVDIFDAQAGTPSLAALSAYDVVLVFGDAGFADSAALGDNLADYYDAGGKVVLTLWAVTNSVSPIAGRFGNVANGYLLLNQGAYAQSAETLGAILEPGSPLLLGVSSLSAADAYHNTGAPVAGAVVVAQWSNGVPLIVRGAMPDGRQRVDLNLFPVSDDVTPSYGFWTGDGAQLISNALLF